MTTFRFSEFYLDRLDKAIESLSRKARKLGLSAPSYTVVNRELKVTESGEAFYEVEVHISDPSEVKINGWQFVAKKVPGTSDNFFVISGGEVPWGYRTSDMYCDHCKRSRRRNVVYILKNEDGDFIQVGKSCLIDFIGHESAGSVAGFLEELSNWKVTLQNDEKECREKWCFDSPSHVVLKTFLVHAVACVDQRGYISGKAAYERGCSSTGSMALGNMADLRRGRKHFPLKDDYFDQAEKILDWYKSEIAAKERLNDYEANLVAALGEGATVLIRHANYAASLIVAYRKAKSLEAERASKTNEFYGNVGDKINDLELTLVYSGEVANSYYPKWLNRFEDQDGRSFVWFSSQKWFADDDIGEAFKFRGGKVKDHNEYKGRKQTMLTRCKLG